MDNSKDKEIARHYVLSAESRLNRPLKKAERVQAVAERQTEWTLQRITDALRDAGYRH